MNRSGIVITDAADIMRQVDAYPSYNLEIGGAMVERPGAVLVGSTKPNVGNVIGERRLVFRDAPRKTVIVTLGKPRRMKGHQDWECPFRIKGADMTCLEFGYGVDALQALTSALEGIRVVLDEIGRPLAWSGVLPDHTGFQRLIPLADGAEFSARLERLVDRELNRHVRQLERRRKKRSSR
jgi:hypothetical protein